MKKILFLVIANSLLQSCKQKPKEKDQDKNLFVPTSSYYTPNKILREVTKIFLDSVSDKNSLKELFIDHIYENETTLTFKAKEATDTYFEMNAPSFIYYYDNKDSIYVYTGIENFLKGDNGKINPQVKSDSSNYFLLLSFTVKDNKYSLDKTASLPFTPKLHYSSQPNIDIKKYLLKDSSSE